MNFEKLPIRVLDLVDRYINWLVWISISLLFIELGFNSNNSLDSSMVLFLWIERITASIFLLEFICRLYEDYHQPEVRKNFGSHRYPWSIMFYVDLLAFLPFLVGFFLPAHLLGWVRALRILRAAKLVRYNTHMQLMVIAFYRSWCYIKYMAASMAVFIMLASVLLFQAERSTFDNIFNCLYFCLTTATTVGYGDYSPTTIVGKCIVVLLLYIPTIFTFSGIVGVVGGLYQTIIQQYNDKEFELPKL